MAHVGIATSGKTLGPTQGLAGLRPSDLRYTVRRATLTVVAIGALIVSLVAATAALRGDADAGVVADEPGTPVGSVSPLGYAWDAGIRQGQIVVVFLFSDDPGGWRLDTTDGVTTFSATARFGDGRLREAAPISLVGLLIAAFGVVFLRTRRRWVLPAAALGLVAASVPLDLAGDPEASTLAMALAAIVPAGAYAIRIPSLPLRVLAVAILGTLAAAWGVVRLGGLDAAQQAEQLRSTVAMAGTLALGVERGLWPAMTRQSIQVVRPRLFDVAVVAAFCIGAIVLGIVFTVPLLALAIGLAAVLLIVPATRRRVGRSLEEALLSDIREQAAAEAAEAERARLARELHDVPLQELAAVIRRLEIKPGTESESEDLRALAGHLRNVATELRPPVLDDLGLPAALDFLAEEATTAALPVTAEVVDDTGFGADRRPPTEVELAMYRIASEAVGNAIKHSGGSEVRITAAVAPDAVELAIADNGAGLGPQAAREAVRQKRLGLASMRRRAQAIDAELTIDGDHAGTEIRVAWRA